MNENKKKVNRRKKLIGVWVEPSEYKEFKKVLIDKNINLSTFFRDFMKNFNNFSNKTTDEIYENKTENANSKINKMKEKLNKLNENLETLAYKILDVEEKTGIIHRILIQKKIIE